MVRHRGIGLQIAAIVVLAVVGMAVVIGSALYQLNHSLLAERQESVRNAVEIALNIVTDLHQRGEAGEFPPAEARRRAVQAISAARYRKDDYVFAYDAGGVLVAHPNPKLVGQSRLEVKDSAGFFYVKEMFRQAGQGGGFTYYDTPKVNQSEPLRKVSYSRTFGPWGWVIASGLYLDDIEAAVWHSSTLTALFAALVLAVVVLVALALGGSIARSLGSLTGSVERLAGGELTVEIRHTGRADEVGQLARAFTTLRDHSIELERLKQQQEALKRQAEVDQRQTRAVLADHFEASVGAIVASVTGAARQLSETAGDMSDSAAQTEGNCTVVAAAADQASSNVQTVAAAAEQLSAAIGEISRQVADSSRIAAQAVAEADQTNDKVAGLQEAAQKIGAVVSLINQIAEQTNLLALNATIEAARAGEAGKGFAVVAGEVKSLAGQTARATGEIQAQVSQMQNVTGTAVEAIRHIGATISTISGIATAIASAVEQQGAATREISRNVQEASRGTGEVSSRIQEVLTSARHTGDGARQTLAAVHKLDGDADTLAGEVQRFVDKVREG